jgi:hypothetical protein
MTKPIQTAETAIQARKTHVPRTSSFRFSFADKRSLLPADGIRPLADLPFDDDHGITAAILELDAERIAAAR